MRAGIFKVSMLQCGIVQELPNETIATQPTKHHLTGLTGVTCAP